jgi:diguanylate cyclase (GGDEF)-like protein/PAS domain S-box-containing protein
MGLAKFFDRSSPSWRSIIAVVAASGFALSFVGWQMAHGREDRLARQDFDARANDHFLVLQNGIDQYLNDMLALRASFRTFQPDRAEFQSFAEQLFDNKNAILAASWLPRVTREERAEFERKAVEDGLAGYQIKSITPDGGISVAPDAPEYFPILYTSKVGLAASAFGLDILDGGLRQQALERARDGDRPAATSIFELRRGEGNRNGFVIALPVYKPGAPHDTLDDRRRNLIGVVQGVFQVSVLVNTILDTATTPAGLDVYFFAAKPAADSLPFYVHQSRLYDEPSPSRSFADVERGLHWSGTLRIADRDWTYVAAARPGGIGTPSHLASLFFLVGGLAMTSMVTAYLWSVRRNASRLEASNQALDRAVGDLDAANARLRDQNSRFDTAINNISQGLAFFDGERRLIVCNRRLIEMYRLPPDKIVPGITLGEILGLRESGTMPVMPPEDYLVWRNSSALSDTSTDTTVELVDGRVIRICRQPMPDGAWVATHEDITAQRRSEQALAEARAGAERAQQDAQAAHGRLVEALEVMPEGMALMDADDRLVLWNRHYAQTYGMTQQIVAGKRFEDILRDGLAHGQYADAIGREEEWLAERLALHRLPSNRFEQRLASGRHVVVEEHRTADGGSIGIRMDVTEIKEREESFRLLFDSNPLPMLVIDADTLRLLAVNDAAVAYYGYARERFLEMSALDIRRPEERPAFSEFMQAFQGSRGAKVWRHQKADGTDILVSVFSTSLSYAGVPTRLAAIVDVTERTRAETMLREQKRRLDSAIDNMSQGLLMFDTEARLLLCNRRYLEMYGLSPEVVTPGCTLRELLDERKRVGSFSDDPEQYSRAILDSVAAGKSRNLMVELGERTFHVVSRPMPGGGWVATHEEITEQKQAEARIHYLAHHDLLTGLPNRAAFNELLAKALERAAAQHGQLAVISADLDRFQEVNDVFGHAVGDEMLRELSRRLKDASGNAFLARLGGDEFWWVLAEGPQPAAAELLAARLMNVAATDIEIDGHLIRTGLSLGIAIYPNDGTDAAALLANADAGLHRAKREGRGSVRFFEAQMDHRLRERRALQHDMCAAIEHDELRVYYQPQAAIDGRILGFEALVRWQHPTRGLISPGLFIPLAEETGAIVLIGEWMLRRACREAAGWDRPLQIAINLSAVQFRHGDLPGLVHSILLETGLAPHRLELEVTESVLIDDFSRAVAILRRLKALGVRIAMDDFGTGYSSLSYLQAFPFDKIKIDQAFISNLDKSPQSAAIVRAIIGLGRALSLPVTAEGVETAEQLAFLVKESCDEVQGYLIGKPLPFEAYASYTTSTKRAAFGG